MFAATFAPLIALRRDQLGHAGGRTLLRDAYQRSDHSKPFSKIVSPPSISSVIPASVYESVNRLTCAPRKECRGHGEVDRALTRSRPIVAARWIDEARRDD